MIDFYHKGDQFGMTLSGFVWVPILLYIMFEFASFGVTNMFLFSKLIYFFKTKSLIKKLKRYRGIPPWWDVKIKFFLINKTSQLGPLTGNRVIDIPIVVYHSNNITGLPIDFHNHNRFTDSFLVIDGKHKYIDVLKRIESYDSINKVDIVKYNRDSILEEIGIK